MTTFGKVVLDGGYQMLQRFSDREDLDRLSCFAASACDLTLRCVVVILALGASTAVVPAQMMSLPEKFEAAGSGAATYSIPIAVPPGTAGMVPALTLQYSSQGGNGMVGMGWSLGGLPAITRCPRNIVQDGVVGAVNYDANDKFCMDGQRLVAISGAYGANGTEYRTEIESFNRVISLGAAGTGPASFEVRTKSGQVMLFGTTADSRPSTSTGTGRSWLLNRIQDSKSNYLTVQYSNDEINGQVYPIRIDYTGNTAAGLAPYNSVQFVYETRSDLIRVYNAGSISLSGMRLTNIQTYTGSTLVSNYVLAYEQAPVSLRSRLTSVTLCAAGGTCLPATSFAWTNGGTGSFTEFSGPIGYDFGAPPQSTWTPISGDFNGDGKNDFLLVKNSTIETFLSNGDRSFNRIEQGTGIDLGAPPTAGNARLLVVGDFNADGKTDFLFFVAGSSVGVLQTFLSNGNGTFTRIESGIAGSFGNLSIFWLISGDFNFDGRSDFALASNTTLIRFLSTGNGTFTRSDVSLPTSYGLRTDGVFNFLSGDFNGDGRTDFTVVGNNGFHTYLGNESGAFTRVDQAACCWGTPPTASWTPFSGDFNGDGKTDFALVSGINFNTYLSKGDGTFAHAYQSIAPGTLGVPPTANWAPISGDINGDGRSDITVRGGNILSTFISDGNGTFTNIAQNTPSNLGSPPSSWLLLSLDYRGIGRSDIIGLSVSTIVGYEGGGGGAGDLLASITTGLGATTSITYTPLTQSSVYTKDTNATYPLQDVIGPAYVISRVDTSNGIGGTYSTTYRYVGAKGDVAGHGYLGFRQMITTDLQTNLIQTTTFRQDFPFIGMVASKTTFAAAQSLRGTSNGFEFRNAGGAATVSTPSITSAPYRLQMTSNTEGNTDLDGTVMPTVTTTTQYDAFNNPTQVVVSTPDGFSKTTTNTYTNDTANWLLGRLTASTVTSQAPQQPGLFCSLPWGATIGNGQSVTAYSAANPPVGQTCSALAQTRTCTNGVLSGGFTQQSCADNCALPWGGTISSGQSVTAYSASNVSVGQTCTAVAQTRTCSNGSLGGSYSNKTCVQQQRIYLTAGASWIVPLDWTNGNNTIEVIAGGGGGSAVAGGRGAGGGGAYSKSANVTLTVGSTVAFAVGTGGPAGNAGGDTYFCNSSSNCASISGTAVVVGAKGGSGATNTAGAAGGGSAGGVGMVRFSGGAGGSNTVPTGCQGGGAGGGAAGPNGAGANGGSGGTCSGAGGGGGGGGTAGASGNSGGGGGLGANSAGTVNGTGGSMSTQAGVASTPGSSANSSSGGGGGAGNNLTLANGIHSAGAAGGAGTEWDSSHGSGGGGGGGQGNGTGVGGAAGLYGAGGGAGSGTAASASGARGIVVITYMPTVPLQRIYLTSGSSWTVPFDWNNASNAIEAIGGGGGGGGGTAVKGGGGGGAYSKVQNISLVPGATVTFAAGNGGSVGSVGGDTYFCNSSSNCASISGTAVVVGAKAGSGAASVGSAPGGASASGVGSIRYSGGAGGQGFNNGCQGGGAGGGAAGPNGAGANGAGGGSCSGGGGGGGGGGTAGASGAGGLGANAAGAVTGSGGAMSTIAGVASTPGLSSSSSGGGGGAGNNLSSNGIHNAGAAGGSGTEWDSLHGSGGGGGGGQGSAQGVGGAAGVYGAGGGGGSGNSASRGGAQGLVVITYTPQ